MFLRGQLCVLILGVLTCAGCGNGLVDLNARVTLDGKPLEGAAVSLISAGATRNRTASGMSDANGKVRFTTFQPNDGVLPGEYKVVVIKTPKSADEEIATYDRNNPEDLKRIIARERSGNVAYTPTLLPRAYLSPETSPLTCTVPPSEGEVLFALESKFEKKQP
jgi:hypothetical protein